MANTKSALKRVRQTETRTLRNRQVKTKVRNLRKKALAAVEAGDAEAAKKAAAIYISAVDKASKLNIFHRNAVARLKSRLAAKVSALGA